MDNLNEKDSDKELDAILNDLAEKIRASEGGASVLVPERLRQVGQVYSLLKRIVRGKDVEISYTLHEPFTSTACVTVVGKEITITRPDLLVEACKAASAYEAYPKAGGTVEMGFAFYGLTRKVGE